MDSEVTRCARAVVADRNEEGWLLGPQIVPGSPSSLRWRAFVAALSAHEARAKEPAEWVLAGERRKPIKGEWIVPLNGYMPRCVMVDDYPDEVFILERRALSAAPAENVDDARVREIAVEVLRAYWGVGSKDRPKNFDPYLGSEHVDRAISALRPYVLPSPAPVDGRATGSMGTVESTRRLRDIARQILAAHRSDSSATYLAGVGIEQDLEAAIVQSVTDEDELARHARCFSPAPRPSEDEARGYALRIIAALDECCEDDISERDVAKVCAILRSLPAPQPGTVAVPVETLRAVRRDLRGFVGENGNPSRICATCGGIKNHTSSCSILAIDALLPPTPPSPSEAERERWREEAAEWIESVRSTGALMPDVARIGFIARAEAEWRGKNGGGK